MESQASPGTAAPESSNASSTGAGSDGRGLTTASGAPLIIPYSESADRLYSGPAAYNPYYWTDFGPGNVVGYDNWFQNIKIGNFDQSATAYVMDPRLAANQEGGLEALRLVQQYVPDATLVAQNFNLQLPGQPPSYNVQLPDGTMLSGGLVLSWYYNNGYGVTQTSDLMLQEAVGLVSPWAKGTAAHASQLSGHSESGSDTRV